MKKVLKVTGGLGLVLLVGAWIRPEMVITSNMLSNRGFDLPVYRLQSEVLREL